MTEAARVCGGGFGCLQATSFCDLISDRKKETSACRVNFAK